MKLSSVLKGIDYKINRECDIEIDGLDYDSRSVKHGSLFFCVPGFETDGHKFAKGAVDNGAVAVVVNHILDDIDVPQIVVEDIRKTMAAAAVNYYGHPSSKMKMVGITGTNGKTTTTYMIKSIAEKAGMKVGLIGTIQNMIGDEVIHTERTTPESIDLQHLLFDMHESGCELVVMEVSSHSLVLDRTYGIDFDIAIFSNLTQDHLDFHKTFKDYADAKALLFAQSEISLINIDDPASSVMIDAAKGKVATYAIDGKADFKAENIQMTSTSTSFRINSSYITADLSVAIPGRFTVYNTLASASACSLLGINDSDIVKALSELKGVDGRFQALNTHNGCTMILDYAHTPDSLKNVLETARGFVKGRLISVFGCGGNRDATKRPKMGAISASLADFTVVTTDNPRFEKPSDIIADIVEGLKDVPKDKYICIENRVDAIRYALENSEPDDVIILAGKGHETYQEIKGVKHDFDEKKIVAEIVSDLMK